MNHDGSTGNDADVHGAKMSDSKNVQFTPDADGFYTMEQAKKLGTPGIKFRTPKGSIGTILPNRSAKGKLQAELTCTAGGPLHVREASDWHQCSVSPEMKKKSKAKVSTETASAPEKTSEQIIQAAQEIKSKLEDKLSKARVLAGLPPTTATEPGADVVLEINDDSMVESTDEVPF